MPPVEALGSSASRSSSAASEYQYNYTYVKPLAMAQSVPAADQPKLEWYGQTIWQVLRGAYNTLRWKMEQAEREQAAHSPGSPLVHAADALSVDLSALGLGKLDLTHLSKLAVPDGTKREFSDLGEAARLAQQCAQLAEKAFKQELGTPFDILKLVMDAVLDKPHGRPQSMQDYTNLFVTLPLPVAASTWHEDDTFAWMQVAGFNPLVIQKAHALEQTLGLSDAQRFVRRGQQTYQACFTFEGPTI